MFTEWWQSRVSSWNVMSVEWTNTMRRCSLRHFRVSRCDLEFQVFSYDTALITINNGNNYLINVHTKLISNFQFSPKRYTMEYLQLGLVFCMCIWVLIIIIIIMIDGIFLFWHFNGVIRPLCINRNENPLFTR